MCFHIVTKRCLEKRDVSPWAVCVRKFDCLLQSSIKRGFMLPNKYLSIFKRLLLFCYTVGDKKGMAKNDIQHFKVNDSFESLQTTIYNFLRHNFFLPSITHLKHLNYKFLDFSSFRLIRKEHTRLGCFLWLCTANTKCKDDLNPLDLHSTVERNNETRNQ